MTKWIHADMMDDVKRLCPDDVTQVNDYTYVIFGVTFIVPGQPLMVFEVMAFLVDNGWEPDDE